MTNETIIEYLAADPNRKDLLALLYNQNAGIIRKQANLFSYNTGLDYDDLAQEGYFCMLAALSAYDPAAGYKFTTYLRNALRWHFMRLASGKRSAVSLDSALSFDDSLTMYDIIPDESIDLEKDITDSFFMSEVGKDLQRAIDGLAEPDRRIIRQRYNEDLSYYDIAIKNGYRDANMAGYALQKALHNLSRAPILKKWRPFFSDQAAAAAYQHIGVAGYQRHLLSSTERAAFKEMGISI